MNQTSISVAIFGVASIILATVMSVQPVLASRRIGLCSGSSEEH